MNLVMIAEPLRRVYSLARNTYVRSGCFYSPPMGCHQARPTPFNPPGDGVAAGVATQGVLGTTVLRYGRR